MTDDMVRELGKQLPYDRPDADRRESVRASLVAAAAQPAAPSPRRWFLVGGGFAAGVLAAAAIALVITRPRTAETTADVHEAYAQIQSSTAAALEHTIVPTPTGTDELVRVHSGTVRLAVPPTRPGDRVRVTTGDAEIEGSGAYEVTVAKDLLAAVTVTAGTATVTVTGQQAVFLAAGQTWRAQVQTADLLAPPAKQSIVASADPYGPATSGGTATTPQGSPIATTVGAATTIRPRVTPASPSIAPRVPATTDQGSPIESELAPPAEQIARDAAVAPAPPQPAPGTEIERHFRAGWALLRANKLADAITELGAAADAGDGPLAADARYYQAIALVKAKRGPEAERALVQFLDRAPTSTRRGRAAMMLGRLLADRGDSAHARAWFELAARDPDPTVAAAAQAALR